jgi:Type IIA topoisomerase (DNA gyrase/topo II, topoisomerase IV), A subunit
LRRQHPQGQAGAQRRNAERGLRDHDGAGDTVAVIGTNHKMVLFPLDQVPEMARGRGVRLQKYSSAKLSDVAVFDSKAGLSWKDSAGREQSMSGKELADWRGNRADAGRLAHGLPKSNKFLRGVE